MADSLARLHVAVWPWPEPELFDKRKYMAAQMMLNMIGLVLMLVMPTFATEIVRDRRVCHMCGLTSHNSRAGQN